MKTYNFAQGSQEWHDHRNWALSGFFSASDAPAMMGCKGAHSTRDQLLRVYKYQIPQEISEYLQRKFDDGHRFEALARPLAEAIMGEDLYPIIGTKGDLSASFDGLTMSHKRGWEHKSINAEIRAAFAAGAPVVLPEKHRIQMQHQMLVSDAEATLFSATHWEGDYCTEELHHWFESDPELGEKIVAAWHQYKLDAKAMPELEVIKDTQMAVIGRAPDALPVLRIRLAGLVTLTENNVTEYRETVRTMLAESNTKPVSDQDFADADKRVKFAGKAEDDLLNAENSLLSETGSVAAVISDLRAMRSEFREFRLAQEKYLAARKDVVRSEIVGAGIRAFAEFKADLFDECISNWPLQSRFVAPEIANNFPGCIKNLRTIESMQNAVNTELAQAKIDARELFETIDYNISTSIELNRHNLWPDLLTLVRKPRDDFHAILTGRIDKADKAEAERIAKAVKAEADRIAQEAKDAAAKELANKEVAEAQARAIKQREDEAERKRLEAEFFDVVDANEVPVIDMPFVLPVPGAKDYGFDLPAHANAVNAQLRLVSYQTAPPSVVTISAPLPPAGEFQTMSIGDINERLRGVTIRADFIESKGFRGLKKGNWIVYAESDWPRIKAAIIEHVRGVK